MNGTFALRYALRSLWRGGQRTFLAMLCVTFGVMSLVSMQLLTRSITNAILCDPRAELGGDALVANGSGVLSEADMARLQQMQAQGVLRAWTPLAPGGVRLIEVESGEVYYIMRTLGVDPDSYPLVGRLTLSEPNGQTLATVLQEPGSAAITHDVADKLRLRAGDTLQLASGDGAPPFKLHVRAIVAVTPSHQGDTILYSLDTARQVAGRSDVVRQATLVWSQPLTSTAGQEPMRQALREAGWNVVTSADVEANQSRSRGVTLFGFMLKGAGILGLLIGGIGVASTMRVLLARRTLEIAMLKTMGYRQRDLIRMFGLETALLGMAGGVTGVAGALAVSAPLVGLFAHVGSMLIVLDRDPWSLATGVLAGVATAVVFGLAVIVSSLEVRPAALLRQLPTSRTWRTHLASGGLYVTLGLVFVGLSSAILHSVTQALAVVAVGLVGLVLLGLLQLGVLAASLHLPVSRGHILRLAQSQLRRNGPRSVFGMLALFVGVFAIGLASVVILSADTAMGGRIDTVNRAYNLCIYAGQSDEATLRQRLAELSAGSVQVRYQTPLRVQTADGMLLANLSVLDGYAASDVDANLTIQGQPWGTLPDGVYLPADRRGRGAAGFMPALGAVLTLLGPNGAQVVARFAGTYEGVPTRWGWLVDPPTGALVSQELAQRLGGASLGLTAVADAPTRQLAQVAKALRQDLPQTIVLSQIDVDSLFQRQLQNLFAFVVAVAALALVAGAVLIANSVGLAMVERRREIGILKSLGYASEDVLKEVLLEQGWLGLIAGASGMLALMVAVPLINRAQPSANLAMHPVLTPVMVALSVWIALLSAILVAWRPTQVRPLEVLRNE